MFNSANMSEAANVADIADEIYSLETHFLCKLEGIKKLEQFVEL